MANIFYQRFDGDGQVMLSAAQVAKITGVNRETVLRSLQSGRLQGVKQGRLWYVSPSAIPEDFKRSAGNPNFSSVVG